jgi:hypothetical protein
LFVSNRPSGVDGRVWEQSSEAGTNEKPLQAPDPRSPMALGMMWVSRITPIALSFVVPTVCGVLVDRFFGTTPWATVIGSILSFCVGTMQVVRIGQTKPPG